MRSSTVSACFRFKHLWRYSVLMAAENSSEDAPIRVVLTDESEVHCLKIVFQARGVDTPLEIFLHTTQAIDLVHRLNLAISELHHRDSALLLLKLKTAELEPRLVIDPFS